MKSIICLLEMMGRSTVESAVQDAAVLAELPVDVQRAFTAGDSAALAAALGTSVYQACYVTAPDNEPTPADAPVDLPEDPEQQESQAA